MKRENEDFLSWSEKSRLLSVSGGPEEGDTVEKKEARKGSGVRG